jgi:predicted enzyme related to lactoylglutathione lyase
MSDKPLGRFCWYELLTTDPGAAQGFYGTVTKWGTSPFEGGEEPYTMWMNGEQPIGGVMELPAEAAEAGAPSHWMAYVSTPDVQATTDKATSLGASILFGPTTIPNVGTFSFMRDPQGAVFSAFEPEGDAPGHDGPAVVGEFSWHELATDDWKGAWSFYSELFGWHKGEAMDMGDMGTYQIFDGGSHPLGGIFDRPPQMPVSAWCLYVRVPDVDAAAALVKANGGQVINGPMEVPGGDRIVQCLDPQGALFALHQTAQP